ncbi:MFS transporter [Saccharobesus litoralis]|uniref:MFS transporter n=1 Tax=Saccharobesus litoralis TaxID=2172099 RepID=A0A2S0VX07_9ALTE|nr:MFS transporter [Saccharobesus litoralis]AWB68757.1 MFS transporter [Saccharobesus litoralis]
MSNQLTRYEKKIASACASVFGLRMLGLFMLMPVMAVYGQDLQGFSPLWVGIIIGAYGLTQALLQIPMGLLSDKFGRKPIILIGLVLFAIGSLVAANSDHVIGVALGRFLQGMGAIAAAVLALAADVTREEQRPKVMAVIGMCIGLSFAVAMVLGPLVAANAGIHGIFWLTAILAGVGILIVLFALPNTVNRGAQRDAIAVPAQLGQLIKNSQLRSLNIGVFFLHLQLTTLFVIIPGLLVASGMSSEKHWMLYLPALLCSFVVMVPLLIWAMKKHKEAAVFKISISVLALSMLVVGWVQQQTSVLIVALITFFAAFNYLEANLPAWVSRIAPAGQKGSAMGIFSTCQFAGAFFGGVLGGWLLQNTSEFVALVAIAALALPWLLLSTKLSLPKRTKPRTVKVNVVDHHSAETLADQLVKLPGIEEAVVFVEEQQAYLKVLPDELDQQQLEALIKA